MSSSEISLYESQDHNYAVNTSTGEAFISQTEAAKLCGVTQQALSKLLSKGLVVGIQPNGGGAFSDKMLSQVVGYYAEKGNKVAIRTLMAFAAAGARAFIYSQAGYDPRPAPAAPPEPPPMKQLPKPTGILVRDHMQPRWYTTTETYKTAMANRSLYPDPNTDNTLWIDWETGEVEPPRRLP